MGDMCVLKERGAEDPSVLEDTDMEGTSVLWNTDTRSTCAKEYTYGIDVLWDRCRAHKCIERQ